MVFEKKQLSKVLAIALMVACAVAFMPLLNGQVFAAKKPGKAKITSLEQADTANDDGTYAVTVAYKAKKAKKYQVSYTDGTEAKTMKTKKKSVSFNGTVDSTYTVKVRGIKGKKKGKWSAAQEIKVVQKATGKMEVTGVVQSGVKQLKVTFGTAVDPATLKFTVTRAGKEIPATVKADPNDPNSVLLDLDSVIADGVAYDVAVATADGTPVPTAAGASTAVSGEKEKVDSIEVDPNLVLDSDDITAGADNDAYEATAVITVKNQFGEDVTKSYYGKVNVSSTIGTVAAGPDKDGKVAIQKILPIQAIAGTKGTIVAVYTETGVNATAEVTVGPAAKISEFAFAGIFNKSTGKEMAIIANDAKGNANAVVKFTAIDQYGRAITATPVDGGNVTVTVVGGLTGLDKEATAITDWTATEEDAFCIELKNLATAKAGDASAIIVANATGAKAQYDFTVGDENVIADLAVTVPAQVIGGVENEFALTVTNGAGDAITDFSKIDKKIKVGDKVLSTAWTDGSKGWRLKKNADGTAVLVYKPDEVTTTTDRLESAVFQAVDTYKTQFITFSVKPGNGIPYDISELTAKGYPSASDQAYLSKMTVIDVFGKEVDYASEAAGKYAVNIELTGTAGDKAALAPYATSITGTGLPTEETGVNYTFDVSGFDPADIDIVGTAKMQAGDAITARVTATLYAKNTSTSKWDKISTSGKTVNVSLAKDVDDAEYDSYGISMTNGIADDMDTIYIGQYANNTWMDGEASWAYRDTFSLEGFGQKAGSDRTYELTGSDGYLLEDDYGFVSGTTFTLTEEAAKKGYTSDTIRMYLPGSEEAVAEKTIIFSSEVPAAASIEKNSGKYSYTLANVTAGHPIDMGNISAALQGYVFDQYNEVYNVASTGEMKASLNDITTAGGISVTEGYAEKYRNKANFYVSTEDADGKVLPADDYLLDVTVTIGGVTQQVELAITIN